MLLTFIIVKMPLSKCHCQNAIVKLPLTILQRSKATENATGKMPMAISNCEMFFGQMSFGQMSFGQMSFGQTFLGQMSFGQMSFGQMPFGQCFLYKCHVKNIF